MDAENRGKSFGVGGYRGRIIFLGDGTEVLTDSDDTEMFDTADEDTDLASQVSKTTAATDDSTAPAPPGQDKAASAASGSDKQEEADREILESNDKKD